MTDRQLAERMAEALEDIEGRIEMASDWINDSKRWNDDGTAFDGEGVLTDWILRDARKALAAYKQHTPNTPCTESSKDQN